MTDGPRTAGDDATGGGSEGGGDPVVLLHVEPDARSAELLAAFAERSAGGFAVRSVDGMRAALDAADAADCVVTEQRLPDGSGVGLVRRLRERGDGVPVVFHTTCRGAETEAAAIDAGADAFFSKRPERGRYERVLDRVRRLAADGPGRSPAHRAASPATPPPAAEGAESEE